MRDRGEEIYSFIQELFVGESSSLMSAIFFVARGVLLTGMKNNVLMLKLLLLVHDWFIY